MLLLVLTVSGAPVLGLQHTYTQLILRTRAQTQDPGESGGCQLASGSSSADSSGPVCVLTRWSLLGMLAMQTAAYLANARRCCKNCASLLPALHRCLPAGVEVGCPAGRGRYPCHILAQHPFILSLLHTPSLPSLSRC